MNLLHVVTSVDPSGGGVTEAVRQLYQAQRAQGHSVRVVSLDAPQASFVKDCPMLIDALGPAYGSYHYSPRLPQFLKQLSPQLDALYTHGLWQFGGLAVRSYCGATSTPYFVFPHGMLDPWFRRHYPGKHLKKLLYWWMAEYRVLKDARAVIFTSDEERRLAAATFVPYSCRDKVVHLGIDRSGENPGNEIEAFFREYASLRGKRFVLFLGRLHEKKGCDVLLKAFAEVSNQAKNVKGDQGELELVMAGPAKSPAYLKELQTLVAELGGEMPARVTWTGMLTGDMKWGAYRAAEAFILPSHQENFGFSVVEALACGTPVLISNQVNIWREIADAGAGLVEDDSLAGTIRLLQQWMSLPTQDCQIMRAAAMACYRSHFQAKDAAEKLGELVK